MDKENNIKEQATNSETRKHILNVVKFMNVIIAELLKRAQNHDTSKLEYPELELFTIYTEKLAGCTYGSDDYKDFLEKLKPALQHHYSSSGNRHHPEHFKDGINDMNLIDIIEMLVDWKSATLRHNDGNLIKSIEINCKRFGIDAQLANILENTAKILDENV
jgi:hypothetical protein